MGMIRRTLPFINVDEFKLLCDLYVRPHLEFSVQAWLPYSTKYIDYMEKVQHRATKMVYGFGNVKYEERLKRLKLFYIQYRRMRGDMIKTYRIISGLKEVNSSQFFTKSNTNNPCGHNLKLCKEHFHKVIRKEFFSQRAIDQWNGLPEEVVRKAEKYVEQFQEFVR